MSTKKQSLESMQNLEVLHNQIRLIMLVFAGMAIVFGFRQFGIKLFKSILLMAILSPFLMAFVKQIPLWVVIPGLLFIIGFVFKAAVGSEVWGHFFGAILYDVLWKMPLHIIGAIGRGIANLFHRLVD